MNLVYNCMSHRYMFKNNQLNGYIWVVWYEVKSTTVIIQLSTISTAQIINSEILNFQAFATGIALTASVLFISHFKDFSVYIKTLLF